MNKYEVALCYLLSNVYTIFHSVFITYPFVVVTDNFRNPPETGLVVKLPELGDVWTAIL